CGRVARAVGLRGRQLQAAAHRLPVLREILAKFLRALKCTRATSETAAAHRAHWPSVESENAPQLAGLRPVAVSMHDGTARIVAGGAAVRRGRGDRIRADRQVPQAEPGLAPLAPWKVCQTQTCWCPGQSLSLAQPSNALAAENTARISAAV